MQIPEIHEKFQFSPDFKSSGLDFANLRQQPRKILIFQKRLLQALRGTLSTSQISQKLGFSFNQYAKWELGQTKLTWGDLQDVCRSRKIDLQDTLNKTYIILHSSPRRENPQDLVFQEFFKQYFFSDYKFLAAYLGVSVARLKRWLEQPQKMPFDQAVKILFFKPQEFILFLASLGILSEFPELDPDHQQIMSYSEAHAELPYLSTVAYCFDTEEYKKLPQHDPQYLKKILFLEEFQIEKAIQKLLNLKAIEFDGGKYYLVQHSLDLYGNSFSQKVKSFNYWLYRWACYQQWALQKGFKQSPDGTVNGFRVFCAPSSSVDKINQVLVEAYNEVFSILKNSTSSDDNLRVLILGHFPLNQGEPYSFVSNREHGFVPN